MPRRTHASPSPPKPRPTSSIIAGIMTAIEQSPRLPLATHSAGITRGLLHATSTGQHHLTMSMLKTFVECHGEYPDLPEIIGQLVTDWLRED